VITLDARELVGEFLSFDKHYNLVLANTEEYRLTKKSLISLKDRAREKSDESESNLIQEQKRSLGLVILRGEQVISVTTESPPLNSTQKLKLKSGTGAIKQIKNPNNASVNTKSSNIKLNNPVRTSALGFSGAPKGFNPPPGFSR
jgi:small nuclear ribonucleoprotein B and B'